jgi:hypothetical protein
LRHDINLSSCLSSAPDSLALLARGLDIGWACRRPQPAGRQPDRNQFYKRRIDRKATGTATRAWTRGGSCGCGQSSQCWAAIRRIRSRCCARAESGHATAPPSSIMNSHRLIRAHLSPRVAPYQDFGGTRRCASQQIRRGDVGSGSWSCEKDLAGRDRARTHLRIKPTASVVRRSTTGGLARIRSSGSGANPNSDRRGKEDAPPTGTLVVGLSLRCDSTFQRTTTCATTSSLRPRPRV